MLLKAVLGSLLFFLAGHVVLKFLDRRSEAAFGPLSYAGVSFMLGLGAISLQMFFYSLVSIQFGAFLISAPWVVLGVAMLFMKAFTRTGFTLDGQKLGWFGAVLFAVILSQVIYSFAYALTMPLSGWDALFIWFVKARAFFLDRSVEAAFLTDPVYVQDHPDYPLLVPLAVSWIYTAIGAAQEEAGKIIYPLQFAALLSLMHYGVRKLTGSRTTGLLFTALLALTPVVLVHAAGFPVQIDSGYTGKDMTGYADLALSAYFLGAGIFIVLFAKEARPFRVHRFVHARRRRVDKERGAHLRAPRLSRAVRYRATEQEGGLALPCHLTLAACALHPAVVNLQGCPRARQRVRRRAMGPAVFFSNISRLASIIPYVADFMFLKPGVTGLAWWAYAHNRCSGL